MFQKDHSDNKLSKSKRLSIYTIFFSAKEGRFIALEQANQKYYKTVISIRKLF